MAISSPWHTALLARFFSHWVSPFIQILSEQISEYIHLFTDTLKNPDGRGFVGH